MAKSATLILADIDEAALEALDGDLYVFEINLAEEMGATRDGGK